MASNVPSPVFAPTGLTIPAESAILSGVQADMNGAFGGSLNPALDTPQGQLASSLTAIIGAKNDLLLQYVNQVDPANAAGRMQDAIGRIYFIARKPALPTEVQAVCSGANGTFINVGALAQAADGNIYTAVSSGTIGAGGTVTLPFACMDPGPIACPAGTLTTIFKSIPGWDSITNPTDGVLGRDVESRADFEARRSASVAINAQGVFPSIRAAVLSVEGVTDAYVFSNDTASAATVGGVSIAAHSLYVCAAGGTNLDVATAIWRKKNPGCGYTGNTTVTVTDTNSGYQIPQPTYSVTFQRPTNLSINFAISIPNSIGVPSDANTQIQNAIASAFVGEDGGPKAGIGATIFALRFVAPIAALGPWAQVISITVNGSADVTPNINQLPTLGTVTVTLV